MHLEPGPSRLIQEARRLGSVTTGALAEPFVVTLSAALRGARLRGKTGVQCLVAEESAE